MRLTRWTDYALRVLMYCAACEGRSAPVTVSEIALNHDISRHHLTKIVQQLGNLQLLHTTRGRDGGIRLMRPASEINIGAVVRAAESDFDLVECFDPVGNRCRMSSHCRLKTALHTALQAYLQVLDRLTRADLVPPITADARPDTATGHVPGLPCRSPRMTDAGN